MRKPDIKKIKAKIDFRQMSKNKKVLVIICAIVLAFVLVLAFRSCGMQPEDTGMTVTTAPAEIMTIKKTAGSGGEIKSSLQEKIIPHAAYKLDEVLVSEGEAVKEGSPILTYTNGASMKAPYNCVVIDWSLPNPKGELTNDHYVTIAGTNVLKMELNVNEDKISMVDKGDPATIKVEAVGKTYKGVVSFISDVGDYSDGSSSFKVDVSFDNDGSLKLGMNGRATIVLAKAQNALCVPRDAVYDDGASSYVTIQKGNDPNNTEDVEVETGLSNKDYVEIKSGLKEGDMVVLPY